MKRTLRTLLTLLLLATCAAGYAEDQTWSHVWDTNKSNGGEGFYHPTGDETTLTTTMKGIEWTLTSESPSVAYTASMGQMIGTTAKPASNVSLFTNGIEGVIKSVEVEVKVKDAVQVADVAVVVDEASYLCDGSATKQMTAEYVKYKFVPAADGAQGKIDIKMTQTGETKGALFIKSITIVYDPDVKEYTTGNYTHIWDKSKNDGGEGFYNFGTSFVDTNTLTASLNNVSWTVTTVGSKKMAFTANGGQSFGVGTSDPCSHIELITNGIAGEITEVIVAAKKGTTSASLSDAAMKVSVGGTAYKCDDNVSAPLTADFVEYHFSPAADPVEGEIKIEIDQTSETQVVIYLKSIVVNYREEITPIDAPTATPAAGSYDEAQTVELVAGEGTKIYYTTDGSNPRTSETTQEYTDAINIAETTTVKAIAKMGDRLSSVAEFKYTIRKDPELSFEQAVKEVDYSDGYYMGVYLNNPYDVSPIRYVSSDENVVKLDGYADLWPIAPGEATITAYFDGNEEYKPATASYKVIVNALLPLETPTVTPSGGTFEGPVDVTITAGSDWGTRAVTIWYSTEAASVEEMEDDMDVRTVWPDAPGFDYSVNTKTITIDHSCTLIVEARGYDSLSSEPLVLEFTIEPTNGINSVNADNANTDAVYNLQGQRVEKAVKGIYIQNGKKHIVK